MRFVDHDNDVVYWYHGVRVDGRTETKLFSSEFSDDYDAIPMYEQIYALAGPIQTFRVTGDPRITDDTEGTLRLFEKFFRDYDQGGYFSHLDPILLSPHHESLQFKRVPQELELGRRPRPRVPGEPLPGHRRGAAPGHAGAHVRHHRRPLPGLREQPVRERAVHARLVARPRAHLAAEPCRGRPQPEDRLEPDADVLAAAQAVLSGAGPEDRRHHAGRSAVTSSAAAWYDVVERSLQPGETNFRFAWHDRKAWWQQEQAILAYLILNGSLGNDDYLRYAREAESFYNSFFLDHDEGGVYFNVLSTGMPYLLGTERPQGQPLDEHVPLRRAVLPGGDVHQPADHQAAVGAVVQAAAHASRTLRVAPTYCPTGRVRLQEVEIDGKPHEVFDARAMTVTLPNPRTV